MRRPLLLAVLISVGLGLVVGWVVYNFALIEERKEPGPQVLAVTDGLGPLLTISDAGTLVFTVDSSTVLVHAGATLDIQGQLRTSGSVGDAGQVLTAGGFDQPPAWKTLADLITTTTVTTDITQTPTSGHLLIADGDSWESVAVGGDAGLTAAGTLTILANAVALTTDTTGNYVATIADSGGTLTVTNGTGEGSAVTLEVTGLNCSDCLDADHIEDIYLSNGANTVLEANLKAVDSPADEECLTYESSGGDFEWQSCGSGGVTADSLDFIDFEDTLDLDAATEINAGAFDFSIDLDSTGDFIIKDAGVAFVTFADDGSVTFVGVVDAGGATSLEVPNGAAPTVNAAGELAVDTTGDDLIFYGAAQRNLSYKQTKTATLESPTDADNFMLFKAPYALTILNIKCIVDPAGTGESVVITVEERDSDGDNAAGVDGATTITCANTSTSDDGSLSNPTIDANDWVSLDIGTVTGTVTQLSVTITYTKDAE